MGGLSRPEMGRRMNQARPSAAILVGVVTITFLMTGRPVAQRAAAPGMLTIEQLIDIRHPSAPMWSPDGRHVVFIWDRAGVSKVYVADATAAQAPRELPEAGSALNGAFWSRDGAALMLPKNGDLSRVPLDGSAASAIWTTPAFELSIVPSPDGSRVAFVRPAGNTVQAAPAARAAR